VNSSGVQANGACIGPAVSGDGQRIVFISSAANLGGTGGAVTSCFLRDRILGTTTKIMDGIACTISGDGWVVVVETSTTAVYAYDLIDGTTNLCTVASDGTPATGFVYGFGVSDDGRYVAFSDADGARWRGDGNGTPDVFVHDRVTGATVCVSVDSNGIPLGDANEVSISGDGSRVAFYSTKSFLPGDTNGNGDVFVRDLGLGLTGLVSSDSSGGSSNGNSNSGAISADGRFVAFASNATNLVANDNAGQVDIFVKDLQTGSISRASVDSNGQESNGFSRAPRITPGGRYVAFTSDATNLVANDTNHWTDGFVRNMAAGTTERMDVADDDTQADAACNVAQISQNGDVVVFNSLATVLVPGDVNTDDVFAVDRCIASWTNYGLGLAGTLGVPKLKASAAPILGQSFDLSLSNSAGKTTTALLMYGFAPARTPIKGGELLLDAFGFLLFAIPTGGVTFPVDLPDDDTLCDLPLFAQALEVDAGAPKKLSFSRGIEFMLGR
jgi:Tol biopolymer transport system component